MHNNTNFLENFRNKHGTKFKKYVYTCKFKRSNVLIRFLCVVI